MSTIYILTVAVYVEYLGFLKSVYVAYFAVYVALNVYIYICLRVSWGGGCPTMWYGYIRRGH